MGDRIYYDHPDGPQPSITTLLRLLPMPWIAGWYRSSATKPVKALLDEPGHVTRQALATALDEGAHAAEAARDRGAAIGSAVHHLVHADITGRLDRGYIRWILDGGPSPWGEGLPEAEREIVLRCYRGMMKWLDGKHVLASEAKRFGEGYGCRVDLVCESQRGIEVVDIKTNKVWDHDKWAMQTAAQSATYGPPAACVFPTVAKVSRKTGRVSWRDYTDSYGGSMRTVHALRTLWGALRGKETE